jgi:ribonuclease HII
MKNLPTLTTIWISNMWITGVDEAGRGPVIGPLVVAALSIPAGDEDKLRQQNVKDSKLLSAKRRSELEEWILSQEEWRHQVIICHPARIDSYVAKMGLNILEVELFAEALNAIGQSEGKIILDACDVNEERFASRIASRLDNWPWPAQLISEHKADLNHLIVAAASILAKQERDRQMANISREVGMNLGSGYPSDAITVNALPAMLTGECPHPQLRWSWKTIRNLWPGEVPQREGITGPQQTLF